MFLCANKKTLRVNDVTFNWSEGNMQTRQKVQQQTFIGVRVEIYNFK